MGGGVQSGGCEARMVFALITVGEEACSYTGAAFGCEPVLAQSPKHLVLPENVEAY